jgi:hypothetical protein
VERWKPIEETFCVYEVSDYGRIRNKKTNRILKPRPSKTGYLRIHVNTQDGRKDLYIHRLVANAFCFRNDGCNVVNHIDFDHTNNNAENLEWTTQSNNILYSMDAGRYPNNQTPVTVIGKKNGKRYLFHSYHDAARATGCDHKSIIRSCKLGNKTKNGFVWKMV